MRRMSQDPEVAQHRLTHGVVRRIVRFARPYRRLIILFLGLIVVTSALPVAQPLLFGAIIDRGVLQGDRRLLVILASTLAVLAVVQAASDLAVALDDDLLTPNTATVRDLATSWPGDPGTVVSLLMHRVTLGAGQAMYLPAGNIHAYLDGLGIELDQAVSGRVSINLVHKIRCGID